jgi:hypothetical protein
MPRPNKRKKQVAVQPDAIAKRRKASPLVEDKLMVKKEDSSPINAVVGPDAISTLHGEERTPVATAVAEAATNTALPATAMEQFFTPTQRFKYLWETCPFVDDFSFNYTEVALTVPVEEFLVCPWDWEALVAFVTTGDGTSKIIWITERHEMCLIVHDLGDLSEFFLDDDSQYDCLLMARFTISVGGQEQTLQCLQLLDADVSTTACSVFWRAIMTSNCVELRLMNNHQHLVELPSGPVLSQLLLASPLLQTLELMDYDLEEEHCRALEALQRTDLKIELIHCMIDPKHKKALESCDFITIVT